MKHAGIGVFGRFSCCCASLLYPSYKSRARLAHICRSFYIEPGARLNHADIHIGENSFIGDRVIMYQAPGGGRIRIGTGTHIHRDSIFETGDGGSISIGDDTHIQPRCQFSAYKGRIEIGSAVQIAPNCAFYPYDHGFERSTAIKNQPFQSKGGILIHDDAWLGVGVIVLDGVQIGRGAVIGAGSVVTKNITDYSIAFGTPARVVNTRIE